ncbi:MAG TPA: pantoate--beta-alanine ligase [Gemmatimonadaceae bacterium]|nr:pantoate--beta-alanine ligase [Gemmatimonadaceae bacterium]
MRVVTTVADVRAAVAAARAQGERISFVPTMGALHEGHLSLVDAARGLGGFVVMSIFVNPLQFGPNEDLARYPRDLEADTRVASDRGTSLVFAPSVDEVYRRERTMEIRSLKIADDWEGASRPGHFAGVLTVVAKLFNIVQPDHAVFGQKDLQQACLIQAMARELDFPVDVVVEPTVRDPDGLALSSRNQFLSPVERKAALALPRALMKIRAAHRSGVRSGADLERVAEEVLDAEQGIELDYLAVVDKRTFKRVKTVGAHAAAVAAIRAGSTRLIDNELLET